MISHGILGDEVRFMRACRRRDTYTQQITQIYTEETQTDKRQHRKKHIRNINIERNSNDTWENL